MKEKIALYSNIKTPVENTKKDKISNSDKTFNKLKEIQELLKKESGLKELCKN